jgi:hypothetical protein
MENEAIPTTQEEALTFLRRAMDKIHEGGNIFYDAALAPAAKRQKEEGLKEGEQVVFCGRYEGYKTLALLASNIRAGKV